MSGRDRLPLPPHTGPRSGPGADKGSSCTESDGMWNVRHQNACEQAEMVIRAALDPTIARKARRGEIVKCIDHFGLLKIAIN